MNTVDSLSLVSTRRDPVTESMSGAACSQFGIHVPLSVAVLIVASIFSFEAMLSTSRTGVLGFGLQSFTVAEQYQSISSI